MDIVYSTSPMPGLKGKKNVKAVNPRFFIAPETDVQTVYLNGDYPDIAKAYKEKGIPVKPLSDMLGLKTAADGEKKGA